LLVLLLLLLLFRNLSLDELYELVVGAPLDPKLDAIAQRLVVLRSPRLASSRLERWTSLVLAPWVARLGRASQLAREADRWLEANGERWAALQSRLLQRDYAPEALSFPEAFSRLTGSPPPAELLRALPVLQRQQVLLPARDLARKTSGWLDKASAWLLAMAGSVERLEPAAAEPEESGAEEEEGVGGPARFPKAMRGWLEERRASLRRFRRRWWPSHPRQRHARRDGDGSQRRGVGRGEGEGSAETSFRHQQAVAVPVVEATARTEEEES